MHVLTTATLEKREWRKALEKNTNIDFYQDSVEQVIVEENRKVADLIGINPATRTTCVKPAGTTSCILGTSSGIHAWHNDYYIRRIRVGKNEPIYAYLIDSAFHALLLHDGKLNLHFSYINPS